MREDYTGLTFRCGTTKGPRCKSFDILESDEDWLYSHRQAKIELRRSSERLR